MQNISFNFFTKQKEKENEFVICSKMLNRNDSIRHLMLTYLNIIDEKNPTFNSFFLPVVLPGGRRTFFFTSCRAN